MEDLGRRLDALANDVKVLRENHLAHIEKDMASLSQKVMATSVDVDWLKRTTFIVLGSSLAGLAGVLYQIAARR